MIDMGFYFSKSFILPTTTKMTIFFYCKFSNNSIINKK